MSTDLMMEVGTSIDRWLRENPDATPEDAAKELTIRYLQKQIHSDGQEKPYLSGQLARVVGMPLEHCPWVDKSWQQRAFEAGYNNPPTA